MSYMLSSVSISLQCLWSKCRHRAVSGQLPCSLCGYLYQVQCLPTSCPSFTVPALLKMASQSLNLCPVVWKWVHRVLGLYVVLCGNDSQTCTLGQKESWPYLNLAKISQGGQLLFHQECGWPWVVISCGIFKDETAFEMSGCIVLLLTEAASVLPQLRLNYSKVSSDFLLPPSFLKS